MSAANTAPAPQQSSPPTADDNPSNASTAPKHEDERQSAFDYWGYLFQSDKTGTDRLKALLAGIKNEINKIYEPSDNPDLTPIQLAGFYRDLHGNYDQLFLATPSESIAFIYKSLGCLHSLQPQAANQSTSFSDPTVPALKTEGWVMWQTIQLLLGPDEHAGFLSEAVQKWDIVDPTNGEFFPKVLPRECFPLEPDKHMVAWYEGVSERLRKEAEEEERQREIEAEQAEVRRLNDRAHNSRHDTDDEGSVDSRGPALAYFRNPLYRHVDGRPTIVRRPSKRHAPSPRPTSLKDKGKEAANTFGHVVRNIGSPHLWDGRGGHHSESRERDRDRRRRSFNDPPDDGALQPPHESPAVSPYDARHHRRNRSAHGARLSAGPDDLVDGERPAMSPRPGSNRHSRRDSREPSIRRHRSHDPTPTSPQEPDDYFQGYEKPDMAPRRSSAQGSMPSPPGAGPTGSATGSSGHGPAPSGPAGPDSGFGPSASPLFATHIARQPQPVPPFQPASRVTSNDSYRGQPKNPSVRRAADRPYSRSPDPSGRPARRDDPRYDDPRSDPRRYESPRRPRYDQSPGRYDDYDDPPAGRRSPHRRPDIPRSHDGPLPHGGDPSSRRHSRRSGSDLSYSGPDDRDRERDRDRDRDRQGGRPPRQTRFATVPPPVAGVDGRRYPNEAPWR